MKVIGDAIPLDNPEAVRVVCSGTNSIFRGCSRVLEIDPEDITRRTERGADYSPEYYYSVTCPNCGVETKVNIDLFPSEVKDLVDARSNAEEHGQTITYRP